MNVRSGDWRDLKRFQREVLTRCVMDSVRVRRCDATGRVRAQIQGWRRGRTGAEDHPSWWGLNAAATTKGTALATKASGNAR